MARPKRKESSGGEEGQHVHFTPELEAGGGGTPGIPGNSLDSHAMQQLAGTELSGRTGLRYATGRRDGKAPEFSLKRGRMVIKQTDGRDR